MSHITTVLGSLTTLFGVFVVLAVSAVLVFKGLSWMRNVDGGGSAEPMMPGRITDADGGGTVGGSGGGAFTRDVGGASVVVQHDWDENGNGAPSDASGR